MNHRHDIVMIKCILIGLKKYKKSFNRFHLVLMANDENGPRSSISGTDRMEQIMEIEVISLL